jgi:glutamate formiminotransferase / formiminotetrahydrofolate cyclodeaminase
MKIVECVPNFSEGRREEVIAAIRDAIAAVEGVTILDVSSDPSHNRSVVTFVAPVERAVDAAFAGMSEARDRIDLRQHTGEHPRMGATDVVPFVPLEGTTMEDCIALARELGERVGRDLDIPVFLYERAATRPTRENLADVRRGEFEALVTEIGSNPAREPDFGPNRVHPSAGATAIGARPFLVAYNIYLGPASNLPIAKKIAKSVRGSSGGFRYVKGLGLDVEGQAQVSMNLVDTTQTPMHRVFDFVKMEAAANGVPVTWSEIVGLVPEKALFEAAVQHMQLAQFTNEQVLESRVREAMSGGQSLSAFVSSIASSSPTPGGGSVAAHAGALGAALVQMVAGLTAGKKKYASVDAEMKETALQAAALSNRLAALVARDAEAFNAVSAAHQLPQGTEEEKEARTAAIQQALIGAAEVPLETARACAAVAELALAVAERGNQNAVTDAGVAALLAETGCRGASYNVRVNVTSLEDKAAGGPLTKEAEELTARTTEFAAKTRAAVDAALA